MTKLYDVELTLYYMIMLAGLPYSLNYHPIYHGFIFGGTFGEINCFECIVIFRGDLTVFIYAIVCGPDSQCPSQQ